MNFTSTQTQFRFLAQECQTARNHRKMPNSGAPVIVQVEVGISVRVAAEMTMGHGSSGSTNLSGSRGSRDPRDP